jgi:(2Fe-2S) ferredoxin
MKYRRHFFICTNKRPPFAKPSCGAKDSNAVFMAFTAELEKRGLAGQIGVTETGCMGPCDQGPIVLVYPEQTWYAGVSVADVKEICDSHMVSGQPVERLVYKWPE